MSRLHSEVTEKPAGSAAWRAAGVHCAEVSPLAPHRRPGASRVMPDPQLRQRPAAERTARSRPVLLLPVLHHPPPPPTASRQSASVAPADTQRGAREPARRTPSPRFGGRLHDSRRRTRPPRANPRPAGAATLAAHPLPAAGACSADQPLDPTSSSSQAPAACCWRRAIRGAVEIPRSASPRCGRCAPGPTRRRSAPGRRSRRRGEGRAGGRAGTRASDFSLARCSRQMKQKETDTCPPRHGAARHARQRAQKEGGVGRPGPAGPGSIQEPIRFRGPPGPSPP